jgi:exonuclease III
LLILSKFCRSSSEHGGSGIYVKDGLEPKEISYFSGISEEKTFEISLIELLGYKLCTVCVYRSQDGQFYKFLHKLELVIQKLLMKDKILLLCGDWNIDFLHEDGNLKNLTDLLMRYNLINTVQSSTRITKNTSTLIDVIIINKKLLYGTCNCNRIRIITTKPKYCLCCVKTMLV